MLDFSETAWNSFANICDVQEDIHVFLYDWWALHFLMSVVNYILTTTFFYISDGRNTKNLVRNNAPWRRPLLKVISEYVILPGSLDILDSITYTIIWNAISILSREFIDVILIFINQLCSTTFSTIRYYSNALFH